MRLVGWNVEGLSPATEFAITEFCDQYSVDLFIAVETWVRNPRLAQPAATEWARFNVICPPPDRRAVRGKGAISLFCRRHTVPHLWRNCPAGSWAVWHTATVIIAGMYTPPRYDRFGESITAFADCVSSASRFLRLPICAIGDFNCRLGSLTGDTVCDPRSPFLVDTMTQCGLSCLNVPICRPHADGPRHRTSAGVWWTWLSAIRVSMPASTSRALRRAVAIRSYASLRPLHRSRR